MPQTMAMPRDQDEAPADPPTRRRVRRRWLAGGVAGLALIGAAAWLWRIDLANQAMSRALAGLGLPARYTVTQVGIDGIVLANVAVGDAAHPDLTIARVVLHPALSGGVSGVGGVELGGVRLHGHWLNNRMSLGSLDRLIYAPSTTPFRLPDLALSISDAQADFTTPAGLINASLDGDGPLRDGFAGHLRAGVRQPGIAGCNASQATLRLNLSIRREQPGFDGPLDLGALHCKGVFAAKSSAILSGEIDRNLAGGEGSIRILPMDGTYSTISIAGLAGDARVVLRGGRLVADGTLQGAGIAGAAGSAKAFNLAGGIRTGAGYRELTGEGNFSASGLAPDRALQVRLAGWQRAAAGTLAAPLIAAVGAGLARETPGNHLQGSFTLRQDGATTSFIAPIVTLTGRTGAPLLQASRLGWRGGAVSGDFITGGPGLPHITGSTDGGKLHLAMADFAAGGAHLAVPSLDVALAGDGKSARLAGNVLASGPIPGGAVSNLALPVNGTVGAAGLALWPQCVRIAAGGLAMSTTRLAAPAIRICPDGAGAALRLGPGGMRLAALIPGLALAGAVNGKALRLTSGALHLGIAGAVPRITGSNLAASLGSGADANALKLAGFTAIVDGAPHGTLSGGEATLAPVPASFTALAGDWRYAGGALVVSGGALTVSDRAAVARFLPLVARGATLTLANGNVTAAATLRSQAGDRALADVTITHNLAAARGEMRIVVSGLTFDKDFQPEKLSPLVVGTVANVAGTVKGEGRIAWSGDAITSSGEARSDGVDFAAAFGPVKGVAGTVVFTDLLNLVTAPDQHLTIAAINPGIEVDNGVLRFAMQPGHVVVVNGAEWPFLDGKLILLPTRMVLGASEIRRYEMKVDGIDAAKFLAHMEISNLSATGTFDGTLPLVFDGTDINDTGRIVGGELVSRAPGGTLSYIGALTYKDLSPMANYAFQTLRSLKYRQMHIAMNGPLSGEIVTAVSLDGVGQGAGAKTNFITRQVAHLPIRFNINIRAPFYQMIGSYRMFSDASQIPDPRAEGLIGADGKPLPKQNSPQPGIQPPVSETKP